MKLEPKQMSPANYDACVSVAEYLEEYAGCLWWAMCHVLYLEAELANEKAAHERTTREWQRLTGELNEAHTARAEAEKREVYLGKLCEDGGHIRQEQAEKIARLEADNSMLSTTRTEWAVRASNAEAFSGQTEVRFWEVSETLRKRIAELERENEALRSYVHNVADHVGSVCQEARHHFSENGGPLGPSHLLRKKVIALRNETQPDVIAALLAGQGGSAKHDSDCGNFTDKGECDCAYDAPTKPVAAERPSDQHISLLMSQLADLNDDWGVNIVGQLLAYTKRLENDEEPTPNARAFAHWEYIRGRNEMRDELTVAAADKAGSERRTYFTGEVQDGSPEWVPCIAEDGSEVRWQTFERAQKDLRGWHRARIVRVTETREVIDEAGGGK